MSIVFITVKGEAQKAFANALHEKTGGAVSLVLIQKPKRLSVWKRFTRFCAHAGLPPHQKARCDNPWANGISPGSELIKTASIRSWCGGLRNFFKECWYGILLRLSPKTRRALDYFHEHSATDARDFLPPVLEIESINSDKAHEILQKLSPKLMVLWGGAVLQFRILKTAKRVVNLHMGMAPWYRGAVANQFAFLRGDYSRIGATIHYAEEKVDAGTILAVIPADTTKPPQELFRDLNDRARSQYIEIAAALYAENYVSATAQNPEDGKMFLLRHWTREIRYKLGRKILRWRPIG